MIALFTDFGLSGPYLGQVRAVLHRDAPGVFAVSLFADAPVANPRAAAYLLAAYGAWFPRDTIFLAVVDPGVGGPRPPLIVEGDGRVYVGPGNGLFELVMRRAASVSAWEIAWRPEHVSATFHGRDLFAPVVARLARGETVARRPLGPESLRMRDWPDDLAEIVYVDHYGNAMTGLRASAVEPDAHLIVAGRALRRARTFGDAATGEPFWYENSNGLVEISVNRGHAASALGLAIGSPVTVA